MKTKIRAAVIGLGRIGFSLGFDKKREQPASHSMALRNSKQIDVVAGCDILADKREKWSRFFPGAAVYQSVNDLMSESKPDIVVIAVEEASHISVISEILLFKPKLIILEKPVALNMEQGRVILDKVKQNGVQVVVNHERRFSSDYTHVLNLIRNGVIGNVLSVNGLLSSGAVVWDSERLKDGGYSLLHDGTHLFDIVRFLLEGNYVTPKLLKLDCESDKVTCLSLQSSIKSTNVFFNILGKSKYFGFELDLIGDKGRIIIGNGYNKVYLRAESKYYTGFYSLRRCKNLEHKKKTGYFSNMVERCVDLIVNPQTKNISTLNEALETLSFIDEIGQLIVERVNSVC